MTLTLEQQEQVRQVGRSVRKIHGGPRRPDGTPKTFDELESEAIEIGNLVSQFVLESNVRDADNVHQDGDDDAEHDSHLSSDEPRGACRCPRCDCLAPRRDDGEPKVVLSDRGEVTWLEAEYFCRKCRRSFFPRTAELGLRVEDTASIRVQRKMVHAGVCAESFGKASEHLRELADLDISQARIRRIALRVGDERILQRQKLLQVFLSKPLLEQLHNAPAETTPPAIACVMSDGGRYQVLDRKASS